jgi:histidyl-tRNA synthetase
VNDRRFLNLLASWGGVPGQVARLGLLLDKLDKQGWAVVRDELFALGFEPSKLDRLVQSVPLDRPMGQVMTWIEFHDWMQAILRDGGITDLVKEDALNALKETEQVVTFFGQNQGTVTNASGGDSLTFDPCLARGIDYYTGLVVEVVAPELGLGSLGGGGMYSGLTALFGYPEWKGMGISFGAERLLEGMDRLGLWDESSLRGMDILCYASDPSLDAAAQSWVLTWRSRGFSADWFPLSGKYKKATEHAQRSEVAWMVVFGEREWAAGEVTLQSTDQKLRHRLPPSEVAAFLQSPTNPLA